MVLESCAHNSSPVKITCHFISSQLSIGRVLSLRHFNSSQYNHLSSLHQTSILTWRTMSLCEKGRTVASARVHVMAAR